MLKIPSYREFTTGFVPTQKQQEYLVDNALRYIREYNAGLETRGAIVTAPTGTGKTATTINALIPEYIRQFKRPDKPLVISYTTYIKTVVDQAYDDARTMLDGTRINGNLIRVYNADEISFTRKNDRGLDGDVIIIITTNQYFNNLNADEMDTGFFDLMIFDEAHGWVGTSGPDDTLVDRGAYLRGFDPKFFKKISRYFSYCPWLLVSATPTKSQRGFTQYGLDNYLVLPPLVLDKMEQPAVQFVVTGDYLDATDLQQKSAKEKSLRVERYLNAIADETWEAMAGVIYKCNIASMLKFARNGSSNGITWEDCIDSYNTYQSKWSIVFNSISAEKTYGGRTLRSMHEGVKLANENPEQVVSLNVVDSGDTGMDLARMRSLGMGRVPSGKDSSNNINNFRQLVGRIMRMMFFRDHTKFIDFVQRLAISDEQKYLVAAYYIEMNCSEVFVCQRHPALAEVRQQVEETTYRHDELSQLILNSLFDDPDQMQDEYGIFISSSSILVNDAYKKFRKDHCEVCEVVDGETVCYTAAKTSLENDGYDFTKDEWQKVLHVHHKDGNHFNNEPENLVTVCPNYHMGLTILEQDYLNRYESLRAEING